jgi:hypothetical protein
MVAPPSDLPVEIQQEHFLVPSNPDNRLIWSHCLTEMREQMDRLIDVRLILGGAVQNYKGKYPGLVEEAYLALKNQKQ